MDKIDQYHAPASLPPKKNPPEYNELEASWASDSAETWCRREKSYFCQESNQGNPSSSQPLYQINTPALREVQIYKITELPCPAATSPFLL